jgi:hypothetical protein
MQSKCAATFEAYISTPDTTSQNCIFNLSQIFRGRKFVAREDLEQTF